MNRKSKVRNLKWMALGAMLLALSFPANAQQPKKVPRIGYLIAGTPSAQAPYIEAFRQGLRDLGYIEGQNIAIEYRYAQEKLDRQPALAAELVSLKVDVILTAGASGTRSTSDRTKRSPQVGASSRKW